MFSMILFALLLGYSAVALPLSNSTVHNHLAPDNTTSLASNGTSNRPDHEDFFTSVWALIVYTIVVTGFVGFAVLYCIPRGYGELYKKKGATIVDGRISNHV
ncbi:hypothetical protein BJ875DRAFT_438130 [Amylocarpus encephaloides]|uniref:Uncharacterized protein n=1 Tax=Amylocarpus encephaloides TaxID=45428 RepID=A0A9P8C8F3_9HELO|nr:hypothetical protein BJ875DRAFT_438130 [Amylocarpus encephaloides]